MKYSLSEKQAAMLREVAAASEALVLPPTAIHTAAALEKRGLIKRTWRSSGPPVAVVTADGRYYLKHGKHPREVQAERRGWRKTPTKLRVPHLPAARRRSVPERRPPDGIEGSASIVALPGLS